MKCTRCGIETPRLMPTQRYCPPCDRDVARLTAPKPVPMDAPPWFRRLTDKDMTGGLR